MSDPTNSQFQIVAIRDLATRKLTLYDKSDSSVRACYRFQNDFLVGLQFVSGAFSFTWNSTEEWATIERGKIVLETISLNEDSTRRAA